jgi:hypothetical protein
LTSKIPKYWYFNHLSHEIIKANPPPIRLGMCSNAAIFVTSTARQALSNCIIKFLIIQIMFSKIRKYWYFCYQIFEIRIIWPSHIHWRTCSCSKYNSMSYIQCDSTKFSTAEIMSTKIWTHQYFTCRFNYTSEYILVAACYHGVFFYWKTWFVMGYVLANPVVFMTLLLVNAFFSLRASYYS